MAAKDFNLPQDLSSPPRHAALVTPNDDEDLDHATRAISFSTAGILTVQMVGDDEPITFPEGSLVPGMQHPMRVSRVFEDSTVTDIFAWW